MAYVKTTWQTGDVITAEKLNNMEAGISRFEIIDAVLNEDDNFVIQMSFADLKSLIDSGKVVFVSFLTTGGTGLVLGVTESNCRVYVTGYTTTAQGSSPTVIRFAADSDDDNPIEIAG